MTVVTNVTCYGDGFPVNYIPGSIKIPIFTVLCFLSFCLFGLGSTTGMRGG